MLSGCNSLAAAEAGELAEALAQGCHRNPFVRTMPADCRISLNRLRFAFSRLRFAWESPGVVCGADPGSGLYKYPRRDFEVVFSTRFDRK